MNRLFKFLINLFFSSRTLRRCSEDERRQFSLWAFGYSAPPFMYQGYKYLELVNTWNERRGHKLLFKLDDVLTNVKREEAFEKMYEVYRKHKRGKD